MKENILIILFMVSITVIFSCKREKITDPIPPWQFNFVLVDSSGQKLFPEPPPNIPKFPFDPANSFWVDGLGIKHNFYFMGNDSTGLVFPMARQLSELNLDTNYVNHRMLHWKVYLHPDSSPINFIVRNPEISSSNADYVLWGGDTLENYYGLGINKIVYP